MGPRKKAAAKLLALWLSGLASQELQKLEPKVSEKEQQCKPSAAAKSKQQNNKACK